MWRPGRPGPPGCCPACSPAAATARLFLTDRKAKPHVAVADIDPGTHRARLSYRRAAELFEHHTARLPGGPFTLHQLRHSRLTHAAEDGAAAYWAVGWIVEAIELLERNLTDSEQVLSPLHSNTLASRNNLADAYRAVGWIDEAIELYERTVTDSEEILGPDHPDTRTVRSSLKQAYEDRRKADPSI
jgi:tetratricopeptide (TPR) repeat protein